MSSIDIIIIAQILLETVPVSSSGHLVIIQSLIARYFPKLTTTVPAYFLELLNIPTLFALAFFFRNELLTSIRRILQLFNDPNTYLFNDLNTHHKKFLFLLLRVFIYAIIANLITTVAYVVHHLIPHSAPTPLVVSIGMFFLMFTLIFLQPRQAVRSMALTDSIMIGLAQSICVSPGVSRLGITFIVAQYLGIQPRRAFQFSFLLHALLSLGLLFSSLLSHPTIPSLSTFSWILITLTTAISVLGLKLSYHLAISNQFWKFALYYPLPIAIIWICLP